MIDPQAYSASVNNQGEARTAGYMPVIGQQKAASEAQNFAQLVNQAQKGTSSRGSASANTAASASSSSGHSPATHHGLGDFLMTLFDIINPLEHLPVISTIYEHVTGHHMNPIARIAGDTLYGGPIGTAVGVANVISERKTGKDIGDNMLAMLSGKNHKAPASADTQVAQNSLPTAHIVWNDASQPPSAAPTAVASAGTAPRIEPSSGPESQQKSLRQNFPSLAATTSHGATAAGKTLADDAVVRTPPVTSAVDRASAIGGWPDGLAAQQTDSTPGPSTQDAPTAAPTRVPPGQFAKAMMDGLDKYAALKTPQMNPGYSAVF